MLRLSTWRKRPRTLREYRRIANKNHGPCHECQQEIFPGDEYEAYVVVYEGKLSVSKFHVDCPEDWYREQDEEARAHDVVCNKAHEQATQKRNHAA